MVGARHLTILMLLVASATACARMQARTPQAVAMHVPPPPPRVPIPVALAEPEEIVDAGPQPAAPPVAPARPRPEPPARGGDKPAAAQPPAVAAPDAPAPALQTTANVGALEQNAAGLLDEAQKNLDRVNYRDLSAHARAQYDRAMSFIRNARGALSIKNYNFAQQLAEKAAAVARELVKG